MSATIDTLKFSKRLQAAGMAPTQAEAIAEAVADGVSEGLATKRDIADLRAATKQDIADLRIATKQDIADLRVAMAELKADLLRWTIGTMIAMTAVFAALVKLL